MNRMPDLPDFLAEAISPKQYHEWLSRKARTHLARDRKRFSSEPTLEEYEQAIHQAVLRTAGRDAYTGDQLDWGKLGQYSNEESRKGRAVYKRTFAKLPTVDHGDDCAQKANFHICGWLTNDAKSDMTIKELIAFCEAVLAHHKRTKDQVHG